MRAQCFHFLVPAIAICAALVNIASHCFVSTNANESSGSLPTTRVVALKSTVATLGVPDFKTPFMLDTDSDNPEEKLRRQVEFASGEMSADVLAALSDKYKTKRPKKVHAALVLVLETTHRKRIVLHSLKSKLDQRQFDRACDLLELEKPRFDDLLERRHLIMQSEDRASIPRMLAINNIATQLLSRKMTGEIFARVKKETRWAAKQTQNN